MTEQEFSREAICEQLEQLADLLEIAEKNEFKIRAYRRGAETLRHTPEPLAELIAENRLTELEGIGEAIAEKIEQVYRTGKIDKFQDLTEEYPANLLELLEIKGLGPRSVRKLFDELNVRNLADLRSSLEGEQVEELAGFGKKTVKNIRQALAHRDKFSGRFLLSSALSRARQLKQHLARQSGVDRVEIAGSCRRGSETVGDLDILLEKVEEVDLIPENLSGVESVLQSGETKVSVRLENGLQADLRVVAPGEFGAAWLYFTGSKQHNIRLRERARKRRQLINEYGLFDQDSGEKIGGATEVEIYNSLELEWIPPELREDAGELEAAESGLSSLVEARHIQGDGHVHTTASDGHNTIEEMARAAEKKGYQFLVISEHSRSLSVAGGLSNSELKTHIERIREVNDKTEKLELLAGAEVDILAGGKLDYPDGLLAQLDLVTAAVHSKFGLPKEEQTARVVQGISHPEVDILAHPTGRLLGQRQPYAIDRDEVLKSAVKGDVAVEINSHGQRLDANAQWCRRGKKLGVEFIISTDSHSVEQLELIELGLKTARRGWLEPAQILNYQGWKRWT